MKPPKVLADVFDAPVFLRTVPDAAAIGAALRAKHGYLCSRQLSHNNASGTAATPTQSDDRFGGGAYVPFARVLEVASSGATSGEGKGGGGGEGGGGSREGMRLAASPRADAKAAYHGMAERSVDGDGVG